MPLRAVLISLCSSELQGSEGTRVDVALDFQNPLDELRIGGQEAYTPTRHVVALAHGVELDAALLGTLDSEYTHGIVVENETVGVVIDDDDAQERSQTEARLWTAIDSLPEKCREVFILSKRDGLKYEEIAEELGLSLNTVRNQISKALKVLKEGVHKLYTFFFA